MLKDSLRTFFSTVQSAGFLVDARQLAQRYLPSGTVDRVPMPEVSFIFFVDARGYDRILLDPLFLMEQYNPLRRDGP